MKPLKKIVLHMLRYTVAFTALLIIPIYICIYRLFEGKREHPRLVWGAIPIINNQYWSNALTKSGFYSKTLMFSYQSVINTREDFDLDAYRLLTFRWSLLQKIFSYLLSPYAAFLYAIWRFDIFHHSFRGGFLGDTLLWRLEAQWLRLAGKKTVIIPYGADAYMYSKIIDPSLRQALLLYSTYFVGAEAQIRQRVDYWIKHADVVMTGALIDGMGRWDLIPFNMLTIDTELWQARKFYSDADGKNRAVTILHAPNHRGFKGTEFLGKAVRELQGEGLKIELIVLEKKQNEVVRRLMAEADILAEQFIAPVYAMNGIEGMASGLPVLANLENEVYTRLFRRYSYLNECPILSTTPETLKHNLRVLVTNPRLREELGRGGRHYVEKYHSEKTAQYMFGAIYDKIWHGKDVDLLNLFHPLLSEYNGRQPLVRHPLIENKLPASYFIDVANFVS
jgi:glycosyltransferase involved in cell wall biosynthesis